MSEMTSRECRFYKIWEVQRKNRWGYILYRGPLHWMAIGFLILLAESAFRMENITLEGSVQKLLFFAMTGMFASYYNFKINERQFLSYLDQEDRIAAGIELLQKNEPWEYENKQFQLSPNKILTVRNILFWLNTESPATDQVEECMKSLRSDLKKMQENQKFGRFSQEMKISLQLFNNVDQHIPLKEEWILPQG